LLAGLKQELEYGNDTIAGVMVEPIQCEGGDTHLSRQVLQGVQELCNEYDALFLVDEIQTGGFATGMGWCFQHYDLIPDVVSFGKKMQQCGIWGGPKVAAFKEGCMHQSGRISSTWSGNIVDMIRATEVMRIIVEDRLAVNVIERGNQFLDFMTMVAAKHPDLISNVRGRGLILAFDAVDRSQRDQILNNLYTDHHLIGLACGDRTVRFRPHLAVTEAEMDECITRVERALDRLQ
jgi:L-lysine 6-transaminase